MKISDTSRKKRSAMESSYKKYYRKLSDKSKKSNEFFEKTKFYHEQHWDLHKEMRRKDNIIKQKEMSIEDMQNKIDEMENRIRGLSMDNDRLIRSQSRRSSRQSSRMRADSDADSFDLSRIGEEEIHE